MANQAGPSADRLYVEFGRRLAQLRKSQKISQTKLGIKLGLTRASIANIEAGRQRILLHHLFQISEALSLPVSDLATIPSRSSKASDLGASLLRSKEDIGKVIGRKYPGLPDPVLRWVATVVASVRDGDARRGE